MFDAPTHFSTHIFSKVCFPLLWEAHFRKTMFSTSDQAYHFFCTLSGFKKGPSCPFCSLLSLFWPFRSLFFRFLSSSKKACGSNAVLISPPKPRQQRRLHASHLQICEFRMPSNVFFVFLLPYTPLSSQNYILLIKNDSRPRWEAQFRKPLQCEIIK